MDFDGDCIRVYPPVERGGMYIAFNDLDESVQAYRLNAAHGGDRKAQQKVNYPDGGSRYAGQIVSQPYLGAADLAARRFIDLGMYAEAYAMSTWIQWAVDCAKRDMALPCDSRKMPTPPKKAGDIFFTDLWRVNKYLPSWYEEQDVKNSYRVLMGVIKERLAFLMQGAITALLHPKKFRGSECARQASIRHIDQILNACSLAFVAIGNCRSGKGTDPHMFAQHSVPSTGEVLPYASTAQMLPTVEMELKPLPTKFQKLVNLAQAAELLSTVEGREEARASGMTTDAIVRTRNAARDAARRVAVTCGVQAELASYMTTGEYKLIFGDVETIQEYFKQPEVLQALKSRGGKEIKFSEAFNVIGDELFTFTHDDAQGRGKVYKNSSAVCASSLRIPVGDIRMLRRHDGVVEIVISHSSLKSMLHYTIVAQDRKALLQEMALKVSAHLKEPIPARLLAIKEAYEALSEEALQVLVNDPCDSNIHKTDETAKRLSVAVSQALFNNRKIDKEALSWGDVVTLRRAGSNSVYKALFSAKQ